MKKIVHLFLIVFIIFTFSCKKEEVIILDMDQTPVLSGGLGYAVVVSAYAKTKLEASLNSEDVSTLRSGDICKVIGRTRVFDGKDKGTWYCIECGNGNGWIFESAVNVYKNESEAQKKSGSIN